MKIHLVTALALVFAAQGHASAEDHLEPENSILGGDSWSSYYDGIVADVLKDAYTNKVVARMVGIPSFQPEYAIGVRKSGGGYSIFALASTVQLWGYQVARDYEEQRDAGGKPHPDEKSAAELRATLPADWHDVKLKRCELSIDAALGVRLVDGWGRMLLETRYPKPAPTETVGVDGESFHFYGYGKSGQTWSPHGGTVAALVDVAYAMDGYCEARSKSARAALDSKLDDLFDGLKRGEVP